MALTWSITDANGVICGPFIDLLSARRFIEEDGTLARPLMLAEIDDKDRRPVWEVLAEAYRARAATVAAKVAS